MLKIQEEIRESSLQEVIDKYSLRFNEFEDLIQLNYGIDSPRGVLAVKECRGIILEKNTWEVVAYPFKRFYNLEEESFVDKVGYNTSILFEKVDGSLIIVYKWKNKWRVSTRGRINADGTVGYSDKTFNQLFYETLAQYNFTEDILDKCVGNNTCLMLELCTLENRVITPYKAPMIRLLSSRHIPTFQESSIRELKEISGAIDIPTPKIYCFAGIDNIKEMISNLPALDEGYVICDYGNSIDGSWKRVKVKNPAYLAVAHMVKGGITKAGLLDIARSGEYDEFIGYFPEYKNMIMEINNNYNKLINDADNIFKDIKHLMGISRKDFALAAIKFKMPSVLFAMIDGKTNNAKEFLKDFDSKKLINYL